MSNYITGGNMSDENDVLSEEDECCIQYEELDRFEVLDFNKDKSDPWDLEPDVFDVEESS